DINLGDIEYYDYNEFSAFEKIGEEDSELCIDQNGKGISEQLKDLETIVEFITNNKIINRQQITSPNPNYFESLNSPLSEGN
ncbi:2846_t:CDS:2, partial [Racocetra fulgida]